MHDWKSLSHVRWDCKYHVVFVPKYRTKKLFGKFRNKVGEILRESGYIESASELILEKEITIAFGFYLSTSGSN